MKLPYLNKCHQPNNIEKTTRKSPIALKTHLRHFFKYFTLAINLGTRFLLSIWAWG